MIREEAGDKCITARVLGVRYQRDLGVTDTGGFLLNGCRDWLADSLLIFTQWLLKTVFCDQTMVMTFAHDMCPQTPA